MKPYYEDDAVTIYHGDALDILPTLAGVGAVITDPPYSSGGAFRGDRAQATVTKYVDSGVPVTAAYPANRMRSAPRSSTGASFPR